MNTSDGTGTEELCIFHDPRSFPAILAGGGNDKVLHPMIIHDVFVRALCIFKGRRKRKKGKNSEKRRIHERRSDAFSNVFFPTSQAANQSRRLSAAEKGL